MRGCSARCLHFPLPLPYPSLACSLAPVQVENRDVYPGTYKGMHVRVWRVNVDHGVSYLDLKRAYSRCARRLANTCRGTALAVHMRALPKMHGICINLRGHADRHLCVICTFIVYTPGRALRHPLALASRMHAMYMHTQLRACTQARAHTQILAHRTHVRNTHACTHIYIYTRMYARAQVLCGSPQHQRGAGGVRAARGRGAPAHTRQRAPHLPPHPHQRLHDFCCLRRLRIPL